MISNFWEELNLKDISKGHEKIMEEMEIPQWMKLDCPFCGKKLPLNSIREFGVKLNARNIGDLYVQVCCVDCRKMDTLYFRSEIDKVTDFIKFLDGSKAPINLPILEEDMYKMQYSNLVDKVFAKKEGK